MARFLCQLCYTVVHYGERHPCFIYKSDDDFYTLPQFNETEEMVIKHTTVENRTENLNIDSEEISSETQEKDAEIPQVISHLTGKKEQVSIISSSKRKRTRKAAFPSKVSAIDNGQIHEIYTLNECHTNLSEPEAALLAGPSSLNTQSLGNGNEVRLVCDICCKGFRQKSDFEQHYITHTGDKPFVCGECGKRFVQKSSLHNHIRIHTGDKPFVCGECGYRFAQKSTLQRHMRIHTREKPYQCSVCSKRFARQDTLQDHFRIHTGEKPYNCKLCGQTFASSGALSSHSRSKHA